MIPPYAELHCVTHFSFLRGASHPEELVERAKAQGYAALAVTDECSLAGAVRAHVKAKEIGLPLLVGAEFGLHGLFGHPDAPVLPPQRPAGGPPDPKDGRTLSTRAAARDSRAPPARLVLLAQDREGYGNLSALITRARMRAAKAHYRLHLGDLDGGVPGCVALL
ncbi:MAG TPA: PHP domain-containing protein, partial [Burkholderiaceae bacterium]|nr:PHP domain-containing protein [Burkholderiaceae bacterium]